jgi:hypothetical protein
MGEQHRGLTDRVCGGVLALGYEFRTELRLNGRERVDVAVFERGQRRPWIGYEHGRLVAVVEIKSDLRNRSQITTALAQTRRYQHTAGVPAWIVAPVWTESEPRAYDDGLVQVGDMQQFFVWLLALADLFPLPKVAS